MTIPVLGRCAVVASVLVSSTACELNPSTSASPPPAHLRQVGLVADSPATGSSAAPTSAPASAGRAAGKAFIDVTAQSGITHRHQQPVLDHQLDNIMAWVASVGAAAAAGDFDNDGWIDLYVTNSHKGTPNYLYRNNRDGTFTDVAKRAGLADLNGDVGVSMDCIWGDYDNDGWIDLYLVRWGTDSLFRNNGDGTFTEVAARLFKKRDGSPGINWANGNGAVWLDYNLDGRLDIYVGNYFDEVDLWHLKSTRIMHDSFEKARNAGRNFMYRQEPDGTFTEVGASLGLDDPGWTLAVGSADLNNDGWPDLYCADDFGPDQLFLNNGDGTFRNATDAIIGADTKKGMNVEFGDFDNDGWLDLFVANITTAEYLQEGNMLWHNGGVSAGGDLVLTDVATDAGVFDGGWGWGGKFLDFDNDGDLDLVAANGFISAGEGSYWADLANWTTTDIDVAEARNWPAIGNRSFSGYERERLWVNDGLGSFTDRAAELGLDTDRDGRGVVVFDYDNDGDLDVFLANQDQPPNLFRNDARTGNHWLSVALKAEPSSKVTRDGIGTRITVLTSAGRQIRERDGGNGYCGQSDPRLCFGLGRSERADLLEVRWPDGGFQYLENVPADQFVTIEQDSSRYTARRPEFSNLKSEISNLKSGISNLKSQTAAAGARSTGSAGARSTGSAGARIPSRTPTERESPPAKHLSPAELDARLGELETELRTRPAAFAPASRYRALCAAGGRHDRAIDFFNSLVDQKPDDHRARIELSLAYVDKIPTCGGMAAMVCKGSLARRGLEQLDPVISAQPDLWVAYYCRGMNHLHWPKGLKHSDDAAADFERCLALQKSEPAAGSKPYFVRTFVALGDAHAKDGKPDEARQVWRDGQALFPESPELRERLAIEDDKAMLKYVESRRSLEFAVDTDMSFLDKEPTIR